MKNQLLPFTVFLMLVSSVLVTSGCRSKRDEIITKRIQYDVNIKSPDPNYDWWIQNLVGPQREKLVELILSGAENGKFQAYDYFFQPISKQDVANILTDTFAVKVRNTRPPYFFRDTLIIEHTGVRDIQRLRFMEEWRIDPKTMQFSKTIKGIAPVARRTDAQGRVQWQPLFWIIPNPKTIVELRKTE